jgi:hypothetical protein
MKNWDGCGSESRSLLLNFVLIPNKFFTEDAQTLQLFTEIIKTESIYKSYQNAKLEGLGLESKWSY